MPTCRLSGHEGPAGPFHRSGRSTGNYDYIEFLAEYALFTQYDLSTSPWRPSCTTWAVRIKVDFQPRPCRPEGHRLGFQSVLFTDCQTADDAPNRCVWSNRRRHRKTGTLGYPNKRFIGFQPRLGQMDYAKRQRGRWHS